MKRKKVLPLKIKNSKIKIALLALGLLFFVLLTARAVTFVSSLARPVTRSLAEKGTSSWDDRLSFNVLFVQTESDPPNFSVISVNKSEKEATILHFSDQIYTELPKGFGSWRIGSVYQLGQEEGQIGGSLLKLSVSKLLGLPIDGIILSKDKVTTEVEALVGSFKSNPLNKFTFFQNVESDLSPFQIMSLTSALSELRSDKLVSLNLERSTITESKLLADSSRVLGVNTVSLDLYVREHLKDSLFYEYGSSIAVFNATDYVGLAGQASRMVVNMGGNVVSVANAPQKVDKSFIYINTLQGPLTEEETLVAQRLSNVFTECREKTGCLKEKSEVISSRARINIVLGKDFFDKWYVR